MPRVPVLAESRTAEPARADRGRVRTAPAARARLSRTPRRPGWPSLPAGAIPNVPQLPPPHADRWLHVPLVDDIAAAGIEPPDLAAWAARPLADVYQEGICGGALLHLNVGQTPHEVIVPLAHQSALAGIMLATQLIVAGIPELRAARPAAIEGRLDVLAGLPQVLARPRSRTAVCLCSDSVFRDVYRAKALHRP